MTTITVESGVDNDIIGFVEADGTLYMPLDNGYGSIGNIILCKGSQTFRQNGNVHPNKLGKRGTPIKKGDKIIIQF